METARYRDEEKSSESSWEDFILSGFYLTGNPAFFGAHFSVSEGVIWGHENSHFKRSWVNYDVDDFHITGVPITGGVTVKIPENFQSTYKLGWTTGLSQEIVTGIPVDCNVAGNPITETSTMDSHPTPSRGSASIINAIELTLKNEAEKGVRVQDPELLISYLISNFDLIKIIEKACYETLFRYKGKAQLSLELYTDPEINDRYVVLYIRQDEYDEDIYDIIDEIRDVYKTGLKKSNGWFAVTTDLNPPR